METKLGIRDLIEATYLGLVALQAGIGALTLPDAWAVVAPLAVAVALAFFARLAGRRETEAKVTKLQQEVGRLLVENGDLSQRLGVALEATGRSARASRRPPAK